MDQEEMAKEQDPSLGVNPVLCRLGAECQVYFKIGGYK